MNIAYYALGEDHTRIIGENLSLLHSDVCRIEHKDISSGSVNRVPPSILIVDMSDEEVIADDLILDLVSTAEFPIIISDQVLTHLDSSQQAAWRNSIEESIKGYFPNWERQAISKIEGETPIVVIGASSGGPTMLRNILAHIKSLDDCSILIVQHIQGAAFDAFCKNLNDSVIDFSVKRLVEGDRFLPGKIFVLHPDDDICVNQNSEISLQPLNKSKHKYYPSIDNTIVSLSDAFPGRVHIAILTGIGNDGQLGITRSLTNIKELVIQDPETCPMRFMPEAAAQSGFPFQKFSPDKIGDWITNSVQSSVA